MTLLFLTVASASCMTQETRSTAECAGRAPKIWFGIILYLNARSSTFLRHDSKEMGRQPLGEEGSYPALGRETTSAILKADGKCPCFRQAWKRSLTRSTISYQHDLGSLISYFCLCLELCLLYRSYKIFLLLVS